MRVHMRVRVCVCACACVLSVVDGRGGIYSLPINLHMVHTGILMFLFVSSFCFSESSLFSSIGIDCFSNKITVILSRMREKFPQLTRVADLFFIFCTLPLSKLKGPCHTPVENSAGAASVWGRKWGQLRPQEQTRISDGLRHSLHSGQV